LYLAVDVSLDELFKIPNPIKYPPLAGTKKITGAQGQDFQRVFPGAIK
jgi:hypothetical protein